LKRIAPPVLVVLALLVPACRAPVSPGSDPHSYARPEEVVVDHLDLDVTVDFERRAIDGRASLHIRNRTGARQLLLDVRQLDVSAVSLGRDPVPANWELGEEDAFLGRPLIVEVEPETEIVHVDYATRPEAEALQWVEPGQTAGGEHPFLLTQSQSIFARTWVPCQDSPGVRMTYDATVRVPPGLMAVMSAENPQGKREDGVYRFRMPQRIPSYLLALAVGDIEFQPLGPRSGVYAEPSVVEKAAWEFADTESMMDAAEVLYGPYPWGRYDTIVLPPSFPFGGMENPRLTFATPTILAGDRSLVALQAHELAHSWSGNLVTNATWEDFWLNEGFTNYLESRIMERVFGRDYAEMEAILGVRELEHEIERLGNDHPDTRLKVDLRGRSSEDSFTGTAYVKGYLFLRMVEETVGRERWDAFLAGYFQKHAFQSMTTEGFVEYLRAELVSGDAGLEERLRIDAWVHGPGLPDNVPRIESARLDAAAGAAERFAAGEPAAALDTEAWTFHQWLHFLRNLPESIERPRLEELDAAFELTTAGNNEILCAWLLVAIANDYDPARPAVERFLLGQGRLKFLRPVYAALLERQPDRARSLYERARPTYHPLSTTALDPLF
jgi:aminopeptidase N